MPLRFDYGQIWGWEGCFGDTGCCRGSCTHVWNYAQAMAHLFPRLERTLRHLEFDYSMDDRGHINFRAALPPGPVRHDLHPAADGQLGGIIKLYRDWRISGDSDWMHSLYPAARLALNYAISQWDPDREGWIREPHHNTYDIEFWGPDGMRYDAVTRHLSLAPSASLEDHATVFFAAETAWGTVSWTTSTVTVEVAEGSLAVQRVSLLRKKAGSELIWDHHGIADPAHPLVFN